MATSLNSILEKGKSSMENTRSAIDVTGQNISNAQTAGYSRQVVNQSAKNPIRSGNLVFGDGARIEGIERKHDALLQSQIALEGGRLAEVDTAASALDQLSQLFDPDTVANLGDQINAFRNAIRGFANMPEDMPTRLNAIGKGQELAQAFRTTYNGIVHVQSEASESIQQEVLQVNQKLASIAALNEEILATAEGSASPNDLLDKRDVLVQEVSKSLNVHAYKVNHWQIALRGPMETLLVDGNQAAHLKLDGNANDTKHIPHLTVSGFDSSSDMDITKYTTGGKIGGWIKVRDHYAQDLRTNVNEIASSFGDALNAVHRDGFGIAEMAGTNGRDFFEGLHQPEEEPAQGICVSFSIKDNPNALSASASVEADGDNIIANRLVKLFDQPIFDKKTAPLTKHYDTMIANLGLVNAQRNQEAKALKVICNKLQSQRDSLAGVSLDEEAANLLKYQHSFDAGARVVKTADEMFQTVLGLKQ